MKIVVDDFEKGAELTHHIYGKGKIIEIDKPYLIVEFSNQVTKKFDLETLEKIRNGESTKQIIQITKSPNKKPKKVKKRKYYYYDDIDEEKDIFDHWEEMTEDLNSDEYRDYERDLDQEENE